MQWVVTRVLDCAQGCNGLRRTHTETLMYRPALSAVHWLVHISKALEGGWGSKQGLGKKGNHIVSNGSEELYMWVKCLYFHNSVLWELFAAGPLDNARRHSLGWRQGQT